MSGTLRVNIVSNAPLTESEYEVIGSVALTLWGIRSDLELQYVVDLVVSFYNDGVPFTEIGPLVVGATLPEEGKTH